MFYEGHYDTFVRRMEFIIVKSLNLNYIFKWITQNLITSPVK